MWKRFDPARLLAVIIGAVIAGLLAGLVASALLTFTAEPLVDQAIALEESHAAHEPNAAAEPEIVSRSQQKGFGRLGVREDPGQSGGRSFAAYGLGGAAYGVLFGIAFLSLRRRSGGRGDRAASRPEDAYRRALLAGAFMAGAFTVMPFLKYPPNPPAVGDPATLSERQWTYLALIFLSLVVLGTVAVRRERELTSPAAEETAGTAFRTATSS